MDLASLFVGLLVGVLSTLLFLRSELHKKLSPDDKEPGAVKPKEAAPPVKASTVQVSENYTATHAYASVVEEACQNLLRATSESLDAWQQFDKRDGVAFSQKELDGSAVPLLRADATIAGPPLGLLGLVKDDANSSFFDPSMKRKNLLEQLDDQSQAWYMEFKGMGPVSGRDFCLVRHVRHLPRGVLMLNVSIQHPGSKGVEARSLVRAHTPFNGWVVRSVGDSDDCCSVTYIANVNLGGSLPNFIVKKATREGVERVLKLKQLAAKCSFGTSGKEAEVQQAFLEHGRQAASSLEEVVAQKGWESAMTKHGVSISRKVGDGSLQKFKGEGVIEAAPEEILRALLDVSLVTQWDPLCKDVAVLAQVDDNTQVQHRHYEARSCIRKSARDFCVTQTCSRRQDGSFLLAAASVECARCPPRVDVVRAKLLPSGWIVKPLPGGSRSSVTYVVQVDLRGGVPAKLVEYAGKRVPLVIHYLSDLLARKVP